MENALRQKLQEDYDHSRPLAKLKRTLSEDDQFALDAMLGTITDSGLAFSLISIISPLEHLLLLLALEQHKQIECLEVLLRRQTARMLELLGSSAIKK